MTTKHTPGPWVVDTNSKYPVIRKNFRADHHMDICGPVHGYMYAEDEKENQAANARLIAAAPELLGALQKVMSWIENWSPEFSNDEEWPADRDWAIDAIAKATGAKS